MLFLLNLRNKMPTGRNHEAPGINWSKQVRTVPVRAKGKCLSCKEQSIVRLNVKGNVNTRVRGHVFGQCANKKCATKPTIKLDFDIKIT